MTDQPNSTSDEETPAGDPELAALVRPHAPPDDPDPSEPVGDPELAALVRRNEPPFDADTALFVVQTPNFFGQIEDLARIQYLRARIFLKLNDLEKARSEIEKPIAIIESQRLRIAKFTIADVLTGSRFEKYMRRWPSLRLRTSESFRYEEFNITASRVLVNTQREWRFLGQPANCGIDSAPYGATALR
jgi:hypothetical protein